MKTKHFFLLVMVGAMGFGQSNAYELATHGKLTFEAYNRSILAQDPKVAKDLGLDINSADPFSAKKFGARYFDAAGNFSFLRVVDPFERERMPEEARPLSVSVAGWLLRGAIREDDVLPAFGDNPQDAPKPDGNINRVCGHFFDPFNNRGLNSTVAVVLCGTGVQPKAPDWALGTFDAFAQPSQPNPGRRNHFTVLDARRAMYNALTGNGTNSDSRTETSRNAWWATTFRALGDVVHLLQDMAQPQHTRNEAHPSLFETGYYEKYIEGRASGENSVRINGEQVPTKPLNFGNYPKPTFTRYSDFFATNPGGNGVLAGKGLAEYSNRGFFTDDHNFGSDAAREFPAPSSNRVDYEEETATFPDLLQNGVQVKFLRGVVPDTQIGGASPTRMTTESAFSRFRVQKLYGLNRYNFDDQADILMPRAVAYSAGLLDYFFRGKIDCKPDPTLPGACRIQNLGTESMKGTFEFFYDAIDGTRVPVPNARWDAVSLPPFDPGISNSAFGVTISPPTVPAPKKPGEYILVFNGDMGQEKTADGTVGAVAAKLITAPASGTLYLHGFDNNFNLIGIKVDQFGTHIMQADEFNPAATISDPLKPMVLKQATFKTSASGALSYTVRAFGAGFPGGPGGSSGPPNSYVLDSASGKYVNQSSYTWVATSPDPGIGQFTFSPIASSTKLGYKRTFTDAAGATIVVTGQVPFPLSNGYLDDRSFNSGKVVVSGDGLTVAGLITDRGKTISYAELRITLAAVPTLVSVVTATETHANSVVSDNESTRTIPTPSSCPAMPHLEMITLRTSRHEERNTLNEKRYIGYINNALVTYQYRLDEVTWRGVKDLGSLEGAACDPIQYPGNYLLYWTGELFGDNYDKKEDFQFADGTLAGRLIPAQPTPRSNFFSYTPNGFYFPPGNNWKVNVKYEGPSLSRSAHDSMVFWEPVNAPAGFTQVYSILRAPTGNSADAIYRLQTSPSAPAKVFFRGIDLTEQQIIVDASPLGEMFLATYDMSTIIHEPKPGGMAKIVIPPNLRRIFAATWF